MLPIKLVDTLATAEVLFAIVWVVAFTPLAGDALERRRELKSARA